MEMSLYRELWFLGGNKLSKRAEKMLKTTLVLEDQSRVLGLDFLQLSDMLDAWRIDY
jgi:hypothetical protein